MRRGRERGGGIERENQPLRALESVRPSVRWTIASRCPGNRYFAARVQLQKRTILYNRHYREAVAK